MQIMAHETHPWGGRVIIAPWLLGLWTIAVAFDKIPEVICRPSGNYARSPKPRRGHGRDGQNRTSLSPPSFEEAHGHHEHQFIIQSLASRMVWPANNNYTTPT